MITKRVRETVDKTQKKKDRESHFNKLFIMCATLILLTIVNWLFFISGAFRIISFSSFLSNRWSAIAVSCSSYDSPQFKRNDITYVHVGCDTTYSQIVKRSSIHHRLPFAIYGTRYKRDSNSVSRSVMNLTTFVEMLSWFIGDPALCSNK